MNDLSMTPLSHVPAGGDVTVTALAGGREFQHRLVSMGLKVGSEVRVLRSGAGGPALVALGHTRLAIGRGMADKIMCRPHAGGGMANDE